MLPAYKTKYFDVGGLWEVPEKSPENKDNIIVHISVLGSPVMRVSRVKVIPHFPVK